MRKIDYGELINKGLTRTFLRTFTKLSNTAASLFYNTIWTIKWAVKNNIKYFRFIAQYRPWDYSGVLDIMEAQLKELCTSMEKYSCEVAETKVPKIARLKRVLEILNNIREDNFAKRCGFIDDAIELRFVKVKNSDNYELIRKINPGFEDYDEEKIFEEADLLLKKEWNELFDILKNDMQGWWY